MDPQALSKALICWSARAGRDVPVSLDPGLAVAAVAAGLLVFWFARCTMLGGTRRNDNGLMLVMMLCSLFVLLLAALLVEGLDGSIYFPSKRNRSDIVLACSPGEFWALAGVYWLLMTYFLGGFWAALVRWRQPLRRSGA